jgi:hypothetical protein
MKLVFIIGDAAVGKMTVGQELMNITELRLFHNHMTIEPVIEIFGGFHPAVINRLREVVFEEFASSGQYGMIFTYMWAFDMPSDWEYIEHVKKIFKQRSPDVEFYYAELVAARDVRLQRNVSENRLKNKPSKRDTAASNRRLLTDDAQHRMESYDGEIPFENYIRIDNTDLSPKDAAWRIKAYFDL